MRLKKQTKLFKWLLPLMLVLVLPQIASAHDFVVDGIYYLKNGNNATVTYRGSSFSSYSNEYTGVVNIPSTVTYNGTTYSVTSIGSYAFKECRSLTSVTIPNSVISIAYEAFNNCSGLISVTIPNSVTMIGDRAFASCGSLTSVAIPNLVISIGQETFYDCSGLTSVTIPNSVTMIGDRAFFSCSSLTSVNIPNSVQYIGKATFYNCGFTSITNPNSVIGIDDSAFTYCDGLISVTIPNSVTSISNSAFSYCNNLTTITLTGYGAWLPQNGMPSIQQLKTVNIGCGISSLGDFGFTPDVVNCYAENPPVCSDGTFANYDGELHVPTTSIASYFMADYWQNFYNLQNDLSKVTLDKADASLVQWESLALTATVTPQGGGEVIWSTTNPSVATVDENGIVTAIGVGECGIYATLASSHDAEYAICHINVAPVEIIISLSEDSLEMNLGDEYALTAIISPSNTVLTPTWTSSDESVATVANGVVTAVGEGDCDIIATVLDKSASCHVSVNGITILISLNLDNAIIGASQMLTVYPSCSPDVPVELVVTSSDPSVAVARVVNRTNAPAQELMSFPEKGMAFAMMKDLAAQSESKAPAYACEKAIMIVGAQSGTATITVTTSDGQAEPAVLNLRVVDVDGDRTITSSDITSLYNYLLSGDNTHVSTSDVNGDGSITSADITILYNLLLGS